MRTAYLSVAGVCILALTGIWMRGFGGIYQGADPRLAALHAATALDPVHEWKTAISFYGKVVDSSGQPVAGATVHLSWTDLSPRGTTHAERITDQAGCFDLRKVTGKNLNVSSVKKPGYAEITSWNRHVFEYAGFWETTYHKPDQQNPVIFHLRKKPTPEPLVHVGLKLLNMPVDGRVAYYAVSASQTTAALADFSVKVTKGVKVERRFDWSVSIEGVNGAGLSEIVDDSTFTAPEEAYLPGWTASFAANSPDFHSQIRTRFFVKAANGKYARIDVRILPDYDDGGALILEAFLNPSGSRNLEGPI